MSSPLLTTAQVAQRLGISPGRIRAKAAHRGIGTKVGRDWLFSEADLAQLQRDYRFTTKRPAG